MNKEPNLIFNITSTKYKNGDIIEYETEQDIHLRDIEVDALFSIVLSVLKNICKKNKINFTEAILTNTELSDKKTLKEISKLEKKLKKLGGNINEEM